jgi:hypothetical protein
VAASQLEAAGAGDLLVVIGCVLLGLVFVAATLRRRTA